MRLAQSEQNPWRAPDAQEMHSGLCILSRHGDAIIGRLEKPFEAPVRHRDVVPRNRASD